MNTRSMTGQRGFARAFVQFCAAALSLVAAEEAMAQQTGTIEGTAEDVNGAPVEGIKVSVRSDKLIGGAREVLTNADGQFRFVELPPGAYEVKAEAKGFKVFIQRGIKLGIGQSADVTVLMEVDSGEDVVTVTAAAPIVDRKKTSLGANLSAEFLEEIPSGRSYQDSAQMVAGTTGGGNPVIHGGSLYSNQYLIDGFNTTDPTTNTFNLNFNFDSIEDLQIITGGLSPEYGNTTGGVVNIVTKSGSNEFHLDTSMYFTGDQFTLQGLDEEDRSFGSFQGNINLSGPIIEDRLWYFLSVEYNDSTSQLTDESPIPALQGVKHPARRYESVYWLGKLTAAPDTHNRFTLLFQGDPTIIDNDDQDPSATPEAETHQDQGGLLASLRWDGLYEPFVFKVQAGYKYSFLDVVPQASVDSSSFLSAGFFGFGSLSQRNDFGKVRGCLGPDDLAVAEDFNCRNDAQASPHFGEGYRINLDNGGISGGSSADTRIERSRWQVTATGSYQAENLAGDHEFKLGTDIALLNDTETEHIPGGAVFYDTDLDGNGVADPYAAYVVSTDDNELTTSADGQSLALFALDNWTVGDWLYMQPGVRFEKATYENFKGEAALDFFVVSPRFSFTVDPWEDGQTRIHGGYGQLYETGNLALSKFVGKSLGRRLAFYDPESGRYVENPDVIRLQGGESGTAIDKDNLEPMRTDEYQLGIERALTENFAVDLTYIHRDTFNAWEDDEANLIWNQAGTDVIGSRDGTGQQTYRLTSLEDATRTYDAFELSFNKAFADAWQLSGSYVLSWYRGTTAELLTGAFDNPRQNPYLEGYLPDDHRHTIKAQALYRFPFGLTLGTQLLHRTGAPYSKLFLNDYDGDYTNRRAPRGRDPKEDLNSPEDDKPSRLPDLTVVDLRASYDMMQLTQHHLELYLDIFNLLNASTVTSVQQSATDDGGFGQPTNRQSPFQAQVGVRYRY